MSRPPRTDAETINLATTLVEAFAEIGLAAFTTAELGGHALDLALGRQSSHHTKAVVRAATAVIDAELLRRIEASVEQTLAASLGL